VTNQPTYHVLARKYRPRSFSEMVGQDALVRTLQNAIKSGRVAHAFIFTGIRGTGKTSTARILARALNCELGPTASPCGTCAQCQAIARDNHVDIIEMDAASRTGVDDIRDLIESVPYAPVMGRYKVYIIDEVHMLSKAAFNALLKTLEEPPAHAKFIFATTEIRKVPTTILSRCQRFDLRRVDAEVLAAHFARIVEAEGLRADQDALELISHYADGSVRDGLSLLDQAISLSDGVVSGQGIRDMLGLVERARSVSIIDAAMGGDAAGALRELRSVIQMGVDPVTVLKDMLDYAHFVCEAAVDPAAANDPTLPETQRRAGFARAKTLGLGKAHQTWNTLLAGLTSAQSAPNPRQAVEQALFKTAAGCRG